MKRDAHTPRFPVLICSFVWWSHFGIHLLSDMSTVRENSIHSRLLETSRRVLDICGEKSLTTQQPLVRSGLRLYLPDPPQNWLSTEAVSEDVRRGVLGLTRNHIFRYKDRLCKLFDQELSQLLSIGHLADRDIESQVAQQFEKRYHQFVDSIRERINGILSSRPCAVPCESGPRASGFSAVGTD